VHFPELLRIVFVGKNFVAELFAGKIEYMAVNIVVAMKISALSRYSVYLPAKDILCQKEQCEMMGDDDDLMLCSVSQNRILEKGKTLSQQGVRSAERLLLF
jgi:hypothetical protein